MKRTSWIDVLLISSIFTLTVIIGLFIFISGDSKFQYSFSSTSNSNEETKKIPNEKNPIVQVQSKYEGIQIYKETSKDPTIPYTVLYPITDFVKLNDQIKQYIENAKQQYITAVRLQNNIDKSVPSNLNINLNIYKYKENYYSLVFTKQESINGQFTDESFNTIFFNQDSGEVINSKALFNKNVSNLEKLSKYVYQKMLEPEGYKENINLSQWKKVSYPYWIYYDRFAIVNETFILYYNKGEFANEKIGSPTISIPLSFLNPILAPEFQSKTKADKTITSPSKGEKVNSKRVALTFDDGPNNTTTLQILKTLDKYEAKATFFMVGTQAKSNPSIVKEVWARGHEIGNHSWNHVNLTKQSSKNIQWQYDTTNNVIFNLIGQYPTVFRPPYGAKNKQVTELIDVPVVLWTIDTLDWKYKDSSKLLPNIQNNIKNNAIILMHDIHQSTANGLDSVLSYLQQEGYECVTVSELLGD